VSLRTSAAAEVEALAYTWSSFSELMAHFMHQVSKADRLCGLVVRVFGYRSGGPGSIPGTTKKK
jgi:hypothetical protein